MPNFLRSLDVHRPLLRSAVMSSATTERRLHGAVFLFLYLLSGITSLAYEVLWIRMLSLQFGVSIFGVVVTVTAFMAGLGLGSLAGSLWGRRLRHPLRGFALLEGGVALFALVTPQLLRSLDGGLTAIAAGSGLSAWLGLQMLAVVLVLMLPAFAMGAGFPMILSAMRGSGVSLASIYGVNAIGGAVGALLPLWLLPAMGWLAGVQSVAAVGLLVAILAWLASLRLPRAGLGMETQERPPWRWLLIYGGIGVAALMLQIGWTRLFGMVLLRTEYVLAVILAIFLVGIGLGSLLARHMRAAWWFSVLPVIACGFALLSLWLLAPLSAWSEQTRFDSLFSALLQQGSAIVSLTLPVTLVLGAWLPLLTRRLGGGHHFGAWLYGANSLGAALGTLLAGFLLIPAIGTSATIVSGALLLLVLGLSWAPSRRWWLAVPLMSLLAWPVSRMPPVSALMPAAYAQAHSIYTHEDAISITHVIEREDGQRQLLADLRRMDASSDPTSVEAQMNQARLPLLLHPAPRSVLFLGLGTGISAAGSLPFPDLQRSAVELSQGAIVAARDYFTPVNGAVSQRLVLVRDDARHFLLSSTAHFDVIIGDLFHPDLVGRSALLSRQQFQRARARLSEGGIFVQWLAMNQFDTRNLDVVLRTFQRVFPDALLFVDGFRLALVGTRGDSGRNAINATAMLANLGRLGEEAASQATGGEGAWTWLGRYWGVVPASAGPVQDEWAPVIEYQLPGARYSGALDLSQLLADLLARRPPLEEAVQTLRVSERDYRRFERAYAATSLAFRSWVALLRQRPAESQRLLPLAYQANPDDRWIAFAMADGILGNMAAAQARGMSERQVLETVLRIRPDHAEALRRLWQMARDDGELALADEYRARLQKLSPLERRLLRPGDIVVSDLSPQ